METTPDAWHGSQFTKDAISLTAETSSDSSGSHAVTEMRAPLSSVSVIDIIVVGPIILCLAGLDLILHINLDLRKIRCRPQPAVHASEFAVPSFAFAAVGVSTFLSFLLVLSLILLWVGILNPVVIQALLPVLDPPSPIWMCGLAVLSSGIALHGWSRLVRWNMASSWQMAQDHRLVTAGPYARVRHPSYLSYMLCFLGLVLMIPFIVSCTILETRALYPQKTALGGLCEVRCVSGQPHIPVSGQ